jgi:transcriptional regulator with GAF, ATPase, and Fis domain
MEPRTEVQRGGPGADSVADFSVTATRGASAGASWLVSGADASRTYVGTSAACAIRIADPHVSRRHLALTATPLGLKTEDLESTNGTWVNGVRVLGAMLRGGETITLGSTALKIEAASEPKPSQMLGSVRFGKVLGASLAMRRLHPVCERIAKSDVPVLIEGETGCGKELLAESIHAMGARASGPFVIFDCTTVAANLLEATLFGHEKGAFTGAVGAKPGVFELADGGTLFLDEIGDLDVMLQAKLLRAIQSSQVQRVGGTKWIKTNVRIISATRRDLEKEIQAGRFRDDLYFRLVVARIEIPPLRDRRDDIPLLARAFWQALGGDEDAYPIELLAALDDYGWPGNVRELHNLVARRLALGDLAPEVRALPPTGSHPNLAHGAPEDVIARVISEHQPFARARERVVFEFERRYLEAALAEHGGNVTKAAEACGIGRRYFYMIKSRSEG